MMVSKKVLNKKVGSYSFYLSLFLVFHALGESAGFLARPALQVSHHHVDGDTNQPSIGSRSIMPSSTTQINALAQYAPQAASLFNNMKTPASILAGAVIPLGFMGPIPLENPDNKEESGVCKSLRVLYRIVACLSFTSELLAVIWSTVATNKLIETAVPKTESVWHLLRGEYSLEWAATNAHFVAGMWGFALLIGIRSYFQAGGGLLGKSLAGTTCSALMLMVAVVNRGVAAGSGDGKLRFGASVLGLWRQYVRLLLKRATNPASFGVLELGSILVLLWSLQGAARAMWQKLTESE